MFGGRYFQQIVGIPMDTNCTPLLTDLYFYSYEAEVIQRVINKIIKPNLTFNSTV